MGLNNFLTGLVAVLLALLFALLIVPGMVTWGDYRAYFEQKASTWSGRVVKIEGPIEIALLPEPVLKFDNVTVLGAQADGTAPFARVGHVEAQLGLASLLGGNLSFSRIDLDRFALALERDRAGKDNWSDILARAHDPAISFFAPDEIRADAINLTDGTVLWRDEAKGQSWSFRKVQGRVQADTLNGPFRGNFDSEAGGQAYTLGFAVASFAGRERADASLSLSAPASTMILTFDGVLLCPENDICGADGKIDFSWGRIKGTTAELDTRALQATANLSLKGDHGQLSDIVARSAGSSFGGNMLIDLSSTPSFALTLRGDTLALDTLLKAHATPDPKAPFAEWLAFPAPSGIDAHVVLAFDDILLGDGLARNVQVDARLTDSVWRIDSASALFNGVTKARLYGMMDGGVFSGNASLKSSSATTTGRWIAEMFPVKNDAVSGDGKAMPLLLDTGFSLSAGRLALDDLVVAYGADAQAPGFRGKVDWLSDGKKSSLSLEAEGKMLDLDPFMPLLEHWVRHEDGRPVALSLASRLDEITARGQTLKGINLDGDVRDENWSIRRLSISDLGGLHVDAIGAFSMKPDGTPAGGATVTLRGAGLDGLARIAGWKWAVPQGAVALDLALLAHDGDQLTVSGTLGGSRLSARLSRGAKPDALTGIKVDAANDDAAQLLRQMGFAPSPVAPGPARIAVALAGKGDGPLKGIVAIAAGSQTATLDSELKRAGDHFDFSGKLHVEAADVARAAGLAGVPQSVAGFIGAQAKGAAGTLDGMLNYTQGKWSLSALSGVMGDTRLSGDLAIATVTDLPTISGALSVNRLDLSSLPEALQTSADETGNVEALDWSGLSAWQGQLDLSVAAVTMMNARFSDLRSHLELGGGALSLSPITAHWAGGALSGNARFSDNGEAGDAGPKLVAHMELADGAADMISAQIYGASFGAAKVKLGLDLEAQGLSRFTFLSSFAGKGRIDLADPVFSGFALKDLATGAHTAKDVSMLSALEKKTLSSGETDASAFGGDIAIANGLMRFNVPDIGFDGGKGALAMQLDLMRFRLDAELKLSPEGFAGAPPVSVIVTGVPGKLERWTETAAFDRAISTSILQKQIEGLQPSQASKDLKKLVTPDQAAEPGR